MHLRYIHKRVYKALLVLFVILQLLKLLLKLVITAYYVGRAPGKEEKSEDPGNAQRGCARTDLLGVSRVEKRPAAVPLQHRCQRMWKLDATLIRLVPLPSPFLGAINLLLPLLGCCKALLPPVFPLLVLCS